MNEKKTAYSPRKMRVFGVSPSLLNPYSTRREAAKELMEKLAEAGLESNSGKLAIAPSLAYRFAGNLKNFTLTSITSSTAISCKFSGDWRLETSLG